MSIGDNMNTKGFTLTEVIVAVAIAGIISMIAFPVVSKIRDDHNKEEYQTYEKVLENGAKLYMDSRKNDEFIEKDRVTIEVSELIKLGYVKEYNKSHVKCNGSVMVKKSNNVLSYQPKITCFKYDQNDQQGNKVYQTPE